MQEAYKVTADKENLEKLLIEKDQIVIYIKTELESSQNKNRQIKEVSNREIQEM